MTSNFEKIQDRKREKFFNDLIAKASRELTPFWFGSKPLLSGFEFDEKLRLLILDPAIQKGTWFLVFTDITTFRGAQLIEVLNEWALRYRIFSFSFLLILKHRYDFLEESAILNQFLQAKKFPAILALDKNDQLSRVFETTAAHTFLGLQNGVPELRVDILSQDSQADPAAVPWYQSAELSLQAFFRTKDPGLATLPLFDTEKEYPEDFLAYDLGTHSQNQNVLHPEFPPTTVKSRFAQFPSLPAIDQLSQEHVNIQGGWERFEDRITTRDSTACLSLWCRCSHLSFIAQSHPKTIDNSVIVLELNGSSVYDEMLADHAKIDDSGKTIVRITTIGLYHALMDLDKPCWVTLRFRNLQLAPLSIFSLRLGGKKLD
jgi:hypothetical protein